MFDRAVLPLLLVAGVIPSAGAFARLPTRRPRASSTHDGTTWPTCDARQR